MSLRRRRWFRTVPAIVLLGLVTGVAVIRRPMLRAVGWVLVVDEPAEPADVIVIPVWAAAAGTIDAADLVHGGIADRVAVLPGPLRPAEQELTRRGIPYVDETADLVQLLRNLGVANIEVISDHAASTEAEGDVLRSWCDQHQFRSVVVVSAPDHSRRLRRVLHRSMRGQPTKVMIRSARYSLFDPDRWWETRDGIRIGLVELQKLLLDFVRRPLS
jgi:hypothetical protein